MSLNSSCYPVSNFDGWQWAIALQLANLCWETQPWSFVDVELVSVCVHKPIRFKCICVSPYEHHSVAAHSVTKNLLLTLSTL